MHDTETVETSDEKYETRDANFRGILLFAGALTVGTLIALIAMWAMFNSLAAREARQDTSPPALAAERTPSTEPKLQLDPPAELDALRAFEEKRLNSYEWINKDAGLARIPIDRAMTLLAEKGLPTRSEARQNETSTQDNPR